MKSAGTRAEAHISALKTAYSGEFFWFVGTVQQQRRQQQPRQNPSPSCKFNGKFDDHAFVAMFFRFATPLPLPHYDCRVRCCFISSLACTPKRTRALSPSAIELVLNLMSCRTFLVLFSTCKFRAHTMRMYSIWCLCFS